MLEAGERALVQVLHRVLVEHERAERAQWAEHARGQAAQAVARQVEAVEAGEALEHARRLLVVVLVLEHDRVALKRQELQTRRVGEHRRRRVGTHAADEVEVEVELAQAGQLTHKAERVGAQLVVLGEELLEERGVEAAKGVRVHAAQAVVGDVEADERGREARERVGAERLDLILGEREDAEGAKGGAEQRLAGYTLQLIAVEVELLERVLEAGEGARLDALDGAELEAEELEAAEALERVVAGHGHVEALEAEFVEIAQVVDDGRGQTVGERVGAALGGDGRGRGRVGVQPELLEVVLEARERARLDVTQRVAVEEDLLDPRRRGGARQHPWTS